MKMTEQSMRGFFNNDLKVLEKITRREEVVDSLRLEITNYLVELMQQELSEEDSKKIPALIHVINDIERIGDHAENLRDLAEIKISQNMPFSEMAHKELRDILAQIMEMCRLAITAVETNHSSDADKIIEMEKVINYMRNQLKLNHVKRLEQGTCKVLSGVVFLDMISNFEKIGDHLNNVGQAVKYQLQWSDVAKG